MTGAIALDHGRLRTVLEEAGEPVVGKVRSDVVAGGRSNVTLRVEDEVGTAWALRRPPTDGVIQSAHDVGREFRVVQGLEKTAVPVPRAVVADVTGGVLGFPFGITEFVPGIVVRSRDDTAAWGAGEFERCTDGLLQALVDLHSVDPDDVGLGDLGRRDGYAERQLSRWSRQWQTMGSTDPRADRLVHALRRCIPEQSGTSVVHGDFRVDNVLLDGADVGRVLAVVDWELSTLGDPFADVGLMCAYRHEALDLVLGLPAAWADGSFPSAAALRAGYEERRSVQIRSFSFYLGLAFYKLAVIAEGIAYRHTLGATTGDGYARVREAVPVLLDAGLEEVLGHG